MKTKLQVQITTVIFLFIVSIVAAPAQSGPTVAVAIDPTTGLPMAQPEPQWIDPNWKDPVKVLPSLNFLDGLPVREVARYLLEQFTNDFDIIIPSSYQLPKTSQSIDSGDYGVTLQLKNVTASEVFRAMNLEFEVENTPLRWQLTMNGSRPTAVLRVVPELIPPQPPPPESRHMVIYVGDLIGFGKSGDTNELHQLSDIADTISRVWAVSGVRRPNSSGHLDIYSPAQLLIVNGTPDQLNLAEQTIAALKQKIQFDNYKSESSQKMETPK